MKRIILSIKPSFSSEIYEGNKMVELRKKVGHFFTENNLIYIYSSSPVKEITGHAVIKQIDNTTVIDIKKFLESACITEKLFDEYYKGHTHGVLIWLKDIVKYDNPLPLEKLKTIGFSAPQSFCYADDKFEQLLNEWLKK